MTKRVLHWNSHITLSDELSYMLVHAEYGRNQVGNCVLELWAPGLPGVRVWFLNTKPGTKHVIRIHVLAKAICFLHAGGAGQARASACDTALRQPVSNESFNWVAKVTRRVKCGQQHECRNMGGVCNQSVKPTPNYALANAKLPNANIASLVSHVRGHSLSRKIGGHLNTVHA